MDILIVITFLSVSLLILAYILRQVVRHRILEELYEIHTRYNLMAIQAIRFNDAVALLRIQRHRDNELKQVKTL